MEKLFIDLNEGYIHLTLGISEERARELGKAVAETVKNARQNGIITDVEKDGQKGVKISGPRLLEILLNDVAQTEPERIMLMSKFESMIKDLRSSMDDTFEQLKDLLKQMKEAQSAGSDESTTQL